MTFNFTIDIKLIVALCIFAFLMYVVYRVARYFDYEQRHQERTSKTYLTINNVDKEQDIRLKEWDN